MKKILLALFIVLLLAGCAKEKEAAGDSYNEDSYFLERAKTTLNHEFCLKIQNEFRRNMCYSEVGIKSADPSVCKKITVNESRGYCNANALKAQGNYSICETYKGYISWKAECYSDIAVAKNNISYCDKIEEGYVSECYYLAAKRLNNPEYCRNVIDENKRDECYAYIAVRVGDSEICKNIETERKRQMCEYESSRS